MFFRLSLNCENNIYSVFAILEHVKKFVTYIFTFISNSFKKTPIGTL